VKLDVVIVDASIARENVAWTVASPATPVALLAGTRVVTVGAVGGAAAVVNVQLTALAKGLPSDAWIDVARFAV
jgi:hypothetical protein